MKLSERLTKRLSDELGLKVASIERVRRGRHGKAAGTWAWSAKTDDGRELGSEDTMRDCVMADRLGARRAPWDFGRTLQIDAVRSNVRGEAPAAHPSTE